MSMLVFLDARNFDICNFASIYLEIFTGKENAKNVVISLGKGERI